MNDVDGREVSRLYGKVEGGFRERRKALRTVRVVDSTLAVKTWTIEIRAGFDEDDATLRRNSQLVKTDRAPPPCHRGRDGDRTAGVRQKGIDAAILRQNERDEVAEFLESGRQRTRDVREPARL